MTKEDPMKHIRQHELKSLRDHINGHAKAVNECSMITIRHHAQGIGEGIGNLGYGTYIKDDTQKREYDFLIETYNMFSDTIRLCNCKKRQKTGATKANKRYIR